MSRDRGQRKPNAAVLERSTVVEKPARPLLQLDFQATQPNTRIAPRARDASIKESIIRWLEQQL